MVLQFLSTEYGEFGKDFADPRIDHYFMMGSPLKIITLVALYLYFVKNLGPKLMENRKPFNINKIVMAYNVLQILLNLTVFTLGAKTVLDNYNICCMPLDRQSDVGLWEAQLTYCYYLLKILDLFDTVIMVLRKNYRQITFLHVYHHTLLALFVYIYTRNSPGGHASLTGVINCFVHVVMYFYYFITSFKPELKKSIWWKKYITLMQMVQFIILVIHFSVPLINGNCSYSKFWLYFGAIQNAVFLGLFSNFYIKSYVKNNKKNIKMK